MINKHIRRLIKPFYTNRKNRKIDFYRLSKTSAHQWDEQIPDSRHLLQDKEGQIKAIGLRILKIIDQISKNNGIKYTLAYGTLLGAIRHKGFIPWDDDIDIFMLKKDFELFVKQSYELPQSVRFFAQGVDFFKVMDKYSIVSKDGKRGVAVDIFIINETDKSYYFYNVHTQKNLHFSKDAFYPLIDHEFEDCIFPIPSKSKSVLSALYGDYMKLPPQHLQISPHSNMEEVKINPYKIL